MNKTNLFLLTAVFFVTVFESFGQLCLKKYQEKNTNYFFAYGIIFYFVVCCLLVMCYKNNGLLGDVNLLWSCMSIIYVILIGYLFLGEKVTNNDIIAVVFAVSAIYFATK